MLALTIENKLTGPLAHKVKQTQLEEITEKATSLEEVAVAVQKIGLGAYRGGHHVAIHPVYNGRFVGGSERIAIITDPLIDNAGTAPVSMIAP